jgi:hypothetical protein
MLEEEEEETEEEEGKEIDITMGLCSVERREGKIIEKLEQINNVRRREEIVHCRLVRCIRSDTSLGECKVGTIIFGEQIGNRKRKA